MTIDKRGVPKGRQTSLTNFLVQKENAPVFEKVAHIKARNAEKLQSVPAPPVFQPTTKGYGIVLTESFVSDPQLLPDIDPGKKPTHVIISLFCGGAIGDLGFHRGFMPLRIKGHNVVHLLAVEADLEIAKQAAASFRKMGEPTTVAAFDSSPENWRKAHNVNWIIEQLKKLNFNPSNGSTLTVITTPPCQAASFVGTREEGSVLDKLSYSGVELVKQLSFRGFFVDQLLYENVVGIKSKWDSVKGQFILNEVEQQLFKLGYAVQHAVIDAANLGAVARRARMVLNAVRGAILPLQSTDSNTGSSRQGHFPRPRFPMPDTPRQTHGPEADKANDILPYNKLKFHSAMELARRPDFRPLPFYGQVGEDYWRRVAAEYFRTRKDLCTVVHVNGDEAKDLVPTAMASYFRHLQMVIQVNSEEAIDMLLEWVVQPCTHPEWLSSIKCFKRTNMQCWEHYWGVERTRTFLNRLHDKKIHEYFRVATVSEYCQIQGFPEEWLHEEDSYENKFRMIGNAVHTTLFEAMGRECARTVECYVGQVTEDHASPKCSDLRMSLVGKFLGFERGNEIVLGAPGSEDYFYVEGRSPKRPEWFEPAHHSGVKERAKDAPNVAYLIPAKY